MDQQNSESSANRGQGGPGSTAQDGGDIGQAASAPAPADPAAGSQEIMGNLPRTRPQRRSSKRAAEPGRRPAAKTASKTRSGARATGATKRRPSPAAATKPGEMERAVERTETVAPRSGLPERAVGAAASAAGASLRVTASVARQATSVVSRVLRRR